MRHALMYHGGFERNFRNLTSGSKTFEGTDGAVHQVPEWPKGADGLRIFYMEKAGKKFCAVTVSDGTTSVLLTNEMVLDPGKHLGFGKRFGSEPTLVEDDSIALGMLEDIIKRNANTACENDLLAIRKTLKAKAPPKK